jgi:hypothetical protein
MSMGTSSAAIGVSPKVGPSFVARAGLIVGGEEGAMAQERALAIAAGLEDAALRLRFERGEQGCEGKQG